MISHEEEKERLAAHALGALDASEARRVEEHLSACADCRAEMEEWRETAGALAYSVSAAEPSPAVRSRILERVRADGEQPALKDAAISKREDASSNIIPMPPQRKAARVAQAFAAIAASVAIIALATSLFLFWRLKATERELARYHTAVDVLAREVSEERGARKLLTSPESQSAVLAGTKMAPGALGHLAFDRSTGHAMLFAYNLPQAPAGYAYQLWFISGDRVMPGKVFTPDQAGQAMINEQVPVASLGSSPIFAITLEPAGGVQTPTGEKYLLSASS